jgi:Cof subfamily protein (haloacid dehalogenase superfamily)
MIKALFFDVDGTLLDGSWRLTERTREALRACKTNGMKVYIATGRPPLLKMMLSLSTEDEELFGDGGVYYNGGGVLDGTRMIYTPLHEDASRTAYDILNRYDLPNVAVQMMNEIQTIRHRLKDEEYPLWGVDRAQMPPYEDVRHDEVIKLFAYSLTDSIEPVFGEIKAAIGGNCTMYLTGHGHNIEIVGKNVTKKYGVDMLADLNGLTHDEIAVFGDDGNDLEMIAGYENSFAMGNASDEIKAAAKFITLSNREDGIYHALKNMLKVI